MGSAFTSKLEGIIKDITISNELKSKFKIFLQNENITKNGHCEPSIIGNSFEFNPKILTCGFWPSIYTLFNSKLKIPNEFSYYLTKFSEFYNSISNNRILKWIPSLGSCQLLARFNSSSQYGQYGGHGHGIVDEYDLLVNQYQCLILLNFNNNNNNSSVGGTGGGGTVGSGCSGDEKLLEISCSEILNQLQINSMMELKSVVMPLLMSKILILSNKKATTSTATTTSSASNNTTNNCTSTSAVTTTTTNSSGNSAGSAVVAGKDYNNFQQLSTDDVLRLNLNFHSKHRKIKIPNLVFKQYEHDNNQQQHGGDIDQTLMRNRKYLLDALIVKIMKSRKYLEHSKLLNEISNLLMNEHQSIITTTSTTGTTGCSTGSSSTGSGGLIFDNKLIKQRIEDLIERDYLERIIKHTTQDTTNQLQPQPQQHVVYYQYKA